MISCYSNFRVRSKMHEIKTNGRRSTTSLMISNKRARDAFAKRRQADKIVSIINAAQHIRSCRIQSRKINK